MFVVETDEDGRLDEATVKDLTGGDRQTARRLYQDFWSFEPTHKLTVGTNHRPAIRGIDNAIWRRILPVLFGVTIPESEQNKNLGDELWENEAPGILNRLVQGCLAWRAGGLAPPPEVHHAAAEYRASEDTLGSFIADRCEVGDDKETGKTELLAAYRNYADGGEFSAKKFGKLLRGRGFSEGRFTSGPNKGREKWQGLALAVNGEA